MDEQLSDFYIFDGLYAVGAGPLILVAIDLIFTYPGVKRWPIPFDVSDVEALYEPGPGVTVLCWCFVNRVVALAKVPKPFLLNTVLEPGLSG